jgi:hypothetical protein
MLHPGLTVNWKGALGFVPPVSLNVTTKLNVPVTDGVPSTMPVEECSVMPVGSAPESTTHPEPVTVPQFEDAIVTAV